MKILIFIEIICFISLSHCGFYDPLYQLIDREPYDKHEQAKNYIQNITAYVDVLSNTVKIIKIPRLAELGVPQYVIDHFVEAIQSKKKIIVLNMNL